MQVAASAAASRVPTLAHRDGYMRAFLSTGTRKAMPHHLMTTLRYHVAAATGEIGLVPDV